jgi:hypothetical protein
MSGRTFYNDALHATQGVVRGDVSFLTDDVNDPDEDDFRGDKELIESIARTGVGEYLVTFRDGFRYIITNTSHVNGLLGFTAEFGDATNEGAGNTTKITQVVTVQDDEGVATETTGRRVSLCYALKNSGNGR